MEEVAAKLDPLPMHTQAAAAAVTIRALREKFILNPLHLRALLIFFFWAGKDAGRP
jgi:acyl dehydratase